ncbi:MAG TPA: TfoX/Sxy family protein [Chitinophagales bacterium]|nr:TfoX/Sxy family protein [Chitinophagales bacterium]
MAYNEKLAARIREALVALYPIEEKEMMGGLSFLYKGKMCVGIIKDEMMCRIDPAIHDEVTEKPGCRTMDFTGRPMKGWIMVAPEAIKTGKDLGYWIGLAVQWNAKAKSSSKKKKK